MCSPVALLHHTLLVTFHVLFQLAMEDPVLTADMADGVHFLMFYHSISSFKFQLAFFNRAYSVAGFDMFVESLG